MDYNTKNYTEQGGDKTVIAGTLEIKEGATVTGLPSSFSRPASRFRITGCSNRNRYVFGYCPW